MGLPIIMGVLGLVGHEQGILGEDVEPLVLLIWDEVRQSERDLLDNGDVRRASV